MRVFHDDPLPFYCSIGVEGAVEGAEEPNLGGGGGVEPPEEEPKPSIRDHLTKGFEDERKGGRNQQRSRRVAGGAEIDAQPVTAQGEEPQGQAEQTTTAPDAFTKEAKAEWAKVPPVVQAAILKREQDMAKGVEELKGKYTELDKAIQPHIEAIRRHGQTPAQAVGQLFAWFQALGANPVVAFPALAKSYGFDFTKIAQAQGGQQAQGQQGQAQTQGQAQGQPDTSSIPEPVKNYITGLENKISELVNAVSQKFGSLENNFQQQAQEKTNETLAIWSKDKPYFEEVRKLMAHFIGSGAVPLKDGKIDLDGAYDMALYAMPEVRAKVLASQKEVEQKAAQAKVAAEKAAQDAAAKKARNAAVSVGGGSPGAANAQSGQRQRAKGKSVRESLQEAIESNRV